MKPNLYIVGGQKCGTTALASFLQQHPDICLVQGKEAHIFDSPAHLTSDDAALVNAYKALLPHYQGEKYLCDATPIYCYLPGIIARLAAFSPQAKVIMLVRDPVDRAISQYQMEHGRGHEPRSLLGAFLAEPTRLKQASDKWALGSPWRIHSYLDRGRFSDQLAIIKQHFKPEQVLVLHNDDLRHQHQATLARVFNFLELANHDVPPQEVFAGQKKNMGLLDRLAVVYARLKLRRSICLTEEYRTF
ncbi:sulfotransferase family protein [Motilimonas sp. KMU-193]|uniref:sulfotransferase family protein n=1 Tax=Motilimonas sp. KMU-193 TaxID=3388668 RepID=UPI00396B0786